MQYKIWEITSYEDYVTNWPLGSRLKKISTYFTKLGYKSGEEFFNKNAYLAQELANQRVGGIIDTVFKTTNLDLNIQKYLIQFTYLAIDHLINNDIEIGENVRNNQTSLNNGRTDTSTTTLSSVEQSVGTMAWRAFNSSTIQILYRSYCENEGIAFLLDPQMFYDKKEIDDLMKEQDAYIIKMKDTIKEDIINDQDFKNDVKGDTGPPGEQGKPGPAGDTGPPGEVSLEQLNTKVDKETLWKNNVNKQLALNVIPFNGSSENGGGLTVRAISEQGTAQQTNVMPTNFRSEFLKTNAKVGVAAINELVETKLSTVDIPSTILRIYETKNGYAYTDKVISTGAEKNVDMDLMKGSATKAELAKKQDEINHNVMVNISVDDYESTFKNMNLLATYGTYNTGLDEISKPISFLINGSYLYMTIIYKDEKFIQVQTLNIPEQIEKMLDK